LRAVWYSFSVRFRCPHKARKPGQTGRDQLVH
jgi:hypothetical protein